MRGIDNLSSGNGGSSTLAGLSDVSVATPANGQVLKYNTTSNKWENANESGGSLDAIDRRFPKISTTSCKPVCNVEKYKWESDTDFLNGIGSILSYIDGRYFWTDGENIYIDNDNYSIHYKLPKDSNVWVSNSWNKSYIDGTRIWTDGDDIYCSYGSYQYVLNKSNHTWEDMQWDNVDTQYLMGSYIWSDGDDIYLNNHSYSYFRKLVKGTNDWTTVAWVNGDLDSQYIWTDGDNIYYSWYYLSTGTNYILDKSAKTWSTITFGNYNLINGLDVWSDGKNIFASDSNGNYKFNKNTKSWYAVDFEGTLANIHITGRDVFTDGYNIYLSMWSNPNHYFAKFKVYKNNIKGAPVVNANVELPIAESEAV